MHGLLNSDCSRHTVVLHGLGGIGKTQLALAYTNRHKNDYSGMFWLNAKDEDSLKHSFANVVRQILRYYPLAYRISSIDVQEDLDGIVDAVKAWFSLPNNTRWLIVYDNYDNPKVFNNVDPAAVDIRKFLPEANQGSVIITTRSSQVETGQLIHIRKLAGINESLEILSNMSRRQISVDGKGI